jgi:hypothetical protein
MHMQRKMFKPCVTQPIDKSINAISVLLIAGGILWYGNKEAESWL